MHDPHRPSRPYRDPWQLIDDIEARPDGPVHREIDALTDELRTLVYLEPFGQLPASQLRDLFVQAERLHAELCLKIATNRSRCIAAGAFLAALVPIAVR